MPADEHVLASMRTMAWERAKGELRSMLQTFWDGENGNFKPLSDKVEAFIKDVEDDGLQE